MASSNSNSSEGGGPRFSPLRNQASPTAAEDYPAGGGASVSTDDAASASRVLRSNSLSSGRRVPLLPQKSRRNDNDEEDDDAPSPTASPTVPGFFSSGRVFQLQYLSFFILGLVNNMGYVVVNSAAKSLADGFGKSNLIGAVVWSNVAFGIGVRFLNAFVLLHTRVSARVMVACGLLVLGCSGLALGTQVSFWMCLVAVVSVGCFSSLGESVLLGYLRSFDPRLMGAWSSGTGMAGIGGTLSYLLFKSVVGLDNMVIFLIQAPFVIVYWLAFRFVERSLPSAPSAIAEAGGVVSPDSAAAGSVGRLSPEPVRDSVVVRLQKVPHADGGDGSGADVPPPTGNFLTYPVTRARRISDSDAPQQYEAHKQQQQLQSPSAAGSGDEPTEALVHSESVSKEREEGPGAYGRFESVEEQEFYANEPTWARTKRVFGVVSSPAIQLMAVYFFEYVVSVGFASKSNPNADESDWWAKNAYELLAFAYQIGVFIARSSVSIMPIKRIEILTALQAAQFALWFVHAAHPFMPLWLQLLVMVFCGLLGGAMYVNVFFKLVKERSLRQQDRELGINLTAIGINCGIVLSSVFEIILFSTMTVFKHEK